MCRRPTMTGKGALRRDARSNEVNRPVSTWSWPRIPPPMVIAAIPLLPTSCYLNRGFTQWFHWIGVLYLLTQWKFLEHFQVISGVSICLGWYSALIYAAIYHGQFCFILYSNMPSIMKDYIFHPATGEIEYDSTIAKAMMVLSHVLDLLGHPLLTYYFWRRHKTNGGTATDIFLSWPVIVSSYLYSRVWSATHTLYNYGRPGYFYIGGDIYIMEHMDCWIPAYAAESVFYATLIAYKLFPRPSENYRCINDYDAPPSLAHSDSGVSRSSSMGSISLSTTAPVKHEMLSNDFGTDWTRM